MTRGNDKAVRALLKAGADIEAQTKDYNGYGSWHQTFHRAFPPPLPGSAGTLKAFCQACADKRIPTAQTQTDGSALSLRIAGRVRDELLRNGGMNWDDDYRKMLDTFQKYFHIANPAGYSDQDIEEILDPLRDGDVNRMLWNLCDCALCWVESNPEVFPPLEAVASPRIHYIIIVPLRLCLKGQPWIVYRFYFCADLVFPWKRIIQDKELFRNCS